jgi:hypothetical protein
MNYSPIEVAIALSLYHSKVGALWRAQKLYDHFDGHCADITELSEALYRPSAVTELAYPTAKLYVEHALERYGKEAKERVAQYEN